MEEETIKRLSEDDWQILINRLRQNKCTPFLGPEMCPDGFNLRTQIAQKFATKWNYPLDDDTDLARVGRYVSAKFDSDFARSELFAEYTHVKPPNFKDTDDPHVVLASLPIPIYVTTNHNDFMMQALKAAGKDANQELCKWTSNITNHSTYLAQNKEPTIAQPVVFHLYGYPQLISQKPVLDSLAFTEDDFFEFLINVASDEDAIPLRIREAMAGTSLLLLGYRMEEWDFRVLFHYLLAKPLQQFKNRTHVAVQLPLDEGKPEEQRKKVQEYLSRYISSKQLKIRVYWGTCSEFVRDLKKKWNETND
jgi:hypothetical protein